MEDIGSVTFAEQVIIDSNLTNIQGEKSQVNDPFLNVVENSLNKLENEPKSEIDSTSDLQARISDFYKSVNLNFEVLPFRISRSVKHLKNYSKTIQSWRGNIIAIQANSFMAELNDLTNGGTLETAEIELESVSPDDRCLIDIGATFYWNVGYRMNHGQITKESIIRFQRVINWEKQDYDRAIDRASELYDNLKIE